MYYLSPFVNILYTYIVNKFYKIKYYFNKEGNMISKKELLGMRIKEFREKKNFTQDKLAEMVGIDPKHLSRIENGRNYPSFETLEKILDSLEISFEDIFQNSHFANKIDIINKINARLINLSEEKLRFIFKMIKEI